LARIAPPAWLSLESLTAIIAYERRETSLFHDETQLPRNYYELSQRMIRCATNSNNSNSNSDTNHDAIALLVQDLLDIRLDKLRQQFQTLVHDRTIEASGEDILIEVNGIGTYELAVLHDFVTRALADKSFLEEVVVPGETTGGGPAAAAATGTSSTNAADTDTNNMPQQQQQQQIPQAIRKSKAPLRKFRTGRN
jgi:GINS complex protein